MEFGFTSEQEAFRAEVRAFCAEVCTPELLGEMERRGDEHSPEFYAELARRGYLGLAWPKAYGGQERGAMDMAIFHEETTLARAPTYAYSTSNLVARTIMVAGTEEQRQRFLPPIARGELLVCLGYSEPDAGSDLASLKTRAARDGDDYLIDGSKMFTTNAHLSDYVFLAARTDPGVPKHLGISMFMVPLDSPGVEIRPVWTMGGERTNATFYDGVRVPGTNRVGEENEGWRVLAVALDLERSAVGFVARGRRLLDEIVAWCRERDALRADPVVRLRVAHLASELEAARLLAYRVAWMQTVGQIPNAEASMAKLYATELLQRIANAGMDILGRAGALRGDAAPLRGAIERAYRGAVVVTIYAGTSEIQRNIIATRGLGLPRG